MLLRHFTQQDLPDLMNLKAAAGWNQTEADWLLFLEIEPQGCFAIEIHGTVVASATAVLYGSRLAWIGMVLTLPEHRGKGFARRLTQAAIDYAGECAIRLDASDMGRPLYESMGFTAECPIERWLRTPAPCSQPEPAVGPIAWDPAFDALVFGADRSILLRKFAASDEGAGLPGAYAFGRAGAMTRHFGPMVSESHEAAASLLTWYVARHAQEHVFMDLFPDNAAASAIAATKQFFPVRRLTRMVRLPERPQIPDSRIYATASFSWG